jgi:hypothetical protein
MQKWEYLHLIYQMKLSPLGPEHLYHPNDRLKPLATGYQQCLEYIANLGNNGWELVTASAAWGDLPPTLWFKRQKE